MPEILIIAGPNGAGKTTASYNMLPDFLGITQFVNADEIAKGLSPFYPESVAIQSGKIMLNRIKELLENNLSFAFETTLSAKSYLPLIRDARQKKYHATLIFLYLRSPELALQRVRQRVLEGGHNIEEEVIRRRYKKGIINLKKLYMHVADEWMVADNSGNTPIFVAKGSAGKHEIIYDKKIWDNILNYE